MNRGHAIPTNATDSEQKMFTNYDVLLVGDYFCDLTKALQDEIIARTEQQSFTPVTAANA